MSHRKMPSKRRLKARFRMGQPIYFRWLLVYPRLKPWLAKHGPEFCAAIEAFSKPVNMFRGSDA